MAAALAGREVGTYVAPRQTKLSARKLWIAFGVPTAGQVVVDDGAAKALVNHGRSLLAVGVADVQGTFTAGQAIEVLDRGGVVVAKGIASKGSGELREASDEASNLVIHRDDLVVFSD